ncbi:colanic acid biosynthesis pyruvyl transferase WcaK [Raoultella sp. X13]|uniref:colanic acid biosynthesis pyruvyl transferase WcaK n=1 Tax=Raoultella sp. X13 TaxID=2259647 RepID=UPI000DE8114F|nr:colanic acid biosynthesis pyruvyl transferase WcaK [Raoultella sp. X13]AXC29494.1 colanic acid biosynthesis pyruvyl transferase WcaK [Raoultella sp. X13]
MKLLLVGNHTCGNRGDAAILRGLLDTLRKLDKNFEIDILSRYSKSSEYLLGETIIQDPLFNKSSKKKTGALSILFDKVKNKCLPLVLMSHIEKKGLLRVFPLPQHITEFADQLKKYDAIIQVGGSFFVDLYGVSQFEHILCSLLANKKIYLIGHSVGPFEGKNFNRVAKYSFSHVELVQLRERVSYDLMVKYGFDLKNVSSSVDTAFLVGPNSDDLNNYMTNHWSKLISEKKTIAITVRKLAPFDKRLGVTQLQYETAFAKIIDYLNDLGYQVIAFSTCTGIESYNNDDRIIGLSIKDLVKNKENYHVVMDELNDLQLGCLFQKCILTIGTRLHSAIISMNFGTPAIAFNYEHKSRGVMNELGMDFLSSDINELITGSVIDKINHVLENNDDVKNTLAQRINTTRARGYENIKEILEGLK